MLDVCCFPSCGKIYQQTLQISQIVENFQNWGGKIFEQREAFVEIGFNAFVVNQQEIEDSILTSNL